MRSSREIFQDVVAKRAEGADDATLAPLFWEAAMTMRPFFTRVLGACFAKQSHRFDDAMQTAMLRAFEAARRFDPDKSSFFLYAKKCVLKARSTTYRHRSVAPMPYNLEILSRKCARANRKFYATHGRDMTVDELMSVTGAPRARVLAVTTLAMREVSTDAPTERETPFGDMLVSTFPSADKLCEAKHEIEFVNNLPHVYRKVLTLRYGLDGGDPKTCLQTGAVMGFSGEYVRKLEVAAMMKLGWIVERKCA